MRKRLAIIAACLFGMASPAAATLVQLNISGTAIGTQSIIKCPVGSPISCFTQYPSGVLTQSYAKSFTDVLISVDLREGDNSFEHGALGGIGLYTGIINNTNGVLTGRNLSYLLEQPGVRTGTLNSYYVNTSARTFSVAAVTAVPEPGSWALMLIGFLVVGSALRQAPRRALLPA